MVDITPAFSKAQEESKKLTSKPTNDELLELYGTFFLLFPPSLCYELGLFVLGQDEELHTIRKRLTEAFFFTIV